MTLPTATITVGDVLEFPELARAETRLVAGAEGQDRRLSWAHVVAGTSAIALLNGAELVLTTGAGWPTEDAALIALSDALVRAEPAAVLLELGGTFDAAPRPLRAACARAGIPLIELHSEVRFVQVTQRIHQRVLDAQRAALEARADVHRMLTDLGLNRSPVDYVIERLSETLGAAVVLEDATGRVVAWSARTGSSPEAVLSAWGPDASASLPTGSDEVAVEAQGKRWGRLVALPGPGHPAGVRTVLELGAFALALGRLADDDEDQWLELSSKRLFDALLSGRFRTDAEIAVQLAAAGLPVDNRILLGATLQGVGDFGAHASLERAVLETALRRAIAPEGRILIVPDPESTRRGVSLIALLSFPEGDERAGDGGVAPPLAARLAREIEMLVPDSTPAAWRAHLGLGAAGRGLRSLITSLERVRAAGRLPNAAATGRVTVQQAERQALAFLVRGIAARPETQEFVHRVLEPVIEHESRRGRGHTGDLFQVLEAYLAHPTNRSLAAKRARMSRSVFYQRLDLLESLLGVDLADGSAIAALSVAMLARE